MSNDTVARQLLRRARYRRIGVGFAVVLLFSILADRLRTFEGRGTDWDAYDGKRVAVVDVTDGDSIVVTSGDGTKTRLRMIGVDAPEMSDKSYWSDRATDYTRARLGNGRMVTLKLDGTQTRDRYGRLLAYVYVTDADNVNLALVRDGHAYADRRHAHSLRSRFEVAEAEARKKARGLWKDVTDDQQPQWRRVWLKSRKN
jgi:micrococcal nuclease